MHYYEVKPRGVLKHWFFGAVSFSQIIPYRGGREEGREGRGWKLTPCERRGMTVL